jgi:opacity protein-like surface antigen
MNKKNYLLTVAAAMVFVAGSVFADDYRSNYNNDNFYIGVQGGANFFSLNQTLVDRWGDQATYTLDSADVGYAAGGFIGYRFNQNWRADVTVDYLNNPDSMLVTDENKKSSELSINWSQLLILLNGYIDFPVTYDFAPFFGLGLGYSKVHVSASNNTSHDYKSGLGVQTAIGFNYSILEDVDLGMSYRLLVSNTQYDAGDADGYEPCHVANSILSVSLSYTFGD